MQLNLRNIWDGKFSILVNGEIREFSNTLTYNGVDLLSRALGGFGKSAITHVYFRFGNALPSESLEAATAADFKNSTGGSGTLYIPVYSTPEFSSSVTGRYQENSARYDYVIPASSVIADASGVWASNNQFSSIKVLKTVGIVCAQDFNNRSEDVLVAAVDISSENITIAANSQVPCSYKLTLKI